MILTEVWVPGHPRTKGSLDVKGGYAADTPLSKRWRVLMAEQVRQDIARRSWRGPELPEIKYPHAGPVAVWFAAWVPRPGGPAATPEPAVWGGAGDIDKLARNLLDALGSPRDAEGRDRRACAELYFDDNQVTRVAGSKFASGPARPQGILIQVVTHVPLDDEPHYLAAADRVRDAARTRS
jgi:hypothetical protein